MSWFESRRSRPVLDLRGAAPVGPRGRGIRVAAGRRALVLGGGLVLLAALAAAGWLWWRQAHPAGGRAGMQAAVDRVGRLMFLPSGETPTYGTVSDKSKLTGQTFFARAENGDEVLIYEKSRLSILYRPSVDKIVNVGPLVVGKQGSPYVTSRIAVLNGTDSTDKLDRMVGAVTAAFPNASIVSKGPASRSYPTTIVADLTAKNQPLAEQVADTLSAQGGKLPLGEPAPSADILIIIGSDYK